MNRRYLSLFIIAAMLCPGKAHADSVYIWQKSYDEGIKTSINAINSQIGAYSVYGGDVLINDGKAVFKPIKVKWEYLAGKKPVTVVFRIDEHLAQKMNNDNVLEIASNCATIMKRVINDAEQKKVKTKGVQTDYDCPTSKLEIYARFMADLKKGLKGYEVSITSLPTWLDSDSFKLLAGSVDYYLLQLYAFEQPKDKDSVGDIFLKDKAKIYFEKASKIGRPFSIALPTFAYEAVFKKDGTYAGLNAEGTRRLPSKAFDTAVASSIPEDIVSFVGSIKKSPTFIGVCWFRLPVEGDDFNWNMKTLLSVINGRTPKTAIRAYAARKKQDYYEVFLKNVGETNILKPAKYEISWDKDAMFVYDINNNAIVAEKQANRVIINAAAPKAGKTMRIGWFRCISGNRKIQVKEMAL